MRSLIPLIVGGLIILTGCQSSAMEPVSTPVPISTEGDVAPMTPSIPTPSGDVIQSLVDKAKNDLSQRLSLSVTQINLVEVSEVEWSDSSLDCPEPGISYMQVITPGYRILLEGNGTTYEYHSNRDTYLVYCEGPTPILPPKP
jgi:hypothetical protein